MAKSAFYLCLGPSRSPSLPADWESNWMIDYLMAEVKPQF